MNEIQLKSQIAFINRYKKQNQSIVEEADLSYSVGGAFLVSRKVHLQSGGENEHFYGWGPEDAERVKRMEILGLPVYRASGPLFHLYHPRKENSWYGSADIELENRQEFLNVCSMTRSDLQKYIQTR